MTSLVAGMDEPPMMERVVLSDGWITGLPGNIDPTKPPKNFKDAMGRKDCREWAKAEHEGFYWLQTLKIRRPEPGAKILGPTTRTEYKTVNAVYRKHKVRLCVMGNQQKEGIHYRL